MNQIEYDPLLSPGEVAALFRVTPTTVQRWARSGKLACIVTPGGHRRYRESQVREFLGFAPNHDANTEGKP